MVIVTKEIVATVIFLPSQVKLKKMYIVVNKYDVKRCWKI